MSNSHVNVITIITYINKLSENVNEFWQPFNFPDSGLILELRPANERRRWAQV